MLEVEESNNLTVLLQWENRTTDWCVGPDDNAILVC